MPKPGYSGWSEMETPFLHTCKEPTVTYQFILPESFIFFFFFFKDLTLPILKTFNKDGPGF